MFAKLLFIKYSVAQNWDADNGVRLTFVFRMDLFLEWILSNSSISIKIITTYYGNPP